MADDFGNLDQLEITVLLEDYAGYDTGLVAQHGLSLLIEARAGKTGWNILFDTGQEAETLLRNMELLGKDPENVDLVFLSHCHYDHTGGLTGFLKASGKSRLPVICHPDSHRLNLALKPAFRSIGMGPANSPGAIEAAGGELVPLSQPLQIMAGVLTSGEIEDKVPFESAPTLSMVTCREGKLEPDRMADDIAMIFILPAGLVVVTGCSHAGIISIIKNAIRLTGIKTILAVVGGFHLVDADDERVGLTVEALGGLSSVSIYTGHCTGLKAEAKLLEQFGGRFNKLRTGMKISF